MKNIDKNFIIIIILLIAVGSLSLMLYFRKVVDFNSMEISEFPKEIAGWTSEDIPLDERTYAILETKNVVMRKYKNPKGNIIYLYIVVSESNRRVAHPPEVCYTGDGLEITEKEEFHFRISGLEEELLVNSFVSRKDRNKSLVFYWYKSGDKFTAHYLTQQAKAAFNQLMGKASIAALIRISTPIDGGGKNKASQILQEFSKKIVPLILEYTP
ncbi:exosortase C-terminal domain/associated protein EpsI [Candidatus Omnitrophota bacterium]